VADQPYWAHTFTERRRTAATAPCPGSCNTPWRKQQQALDDYQQAVEAWAQNPAGNPPQEPVIVKPLSPWPGDPVFCGRDAAVLRRQLKEIDDAASLCAAEADGHRSRPAGERIRGSKSAPSPSPHLDDLDELAHMLRGWEAVARGDEDTPPRRGRLATEITTVVAWLTVHFDTLIQNRDVALDFAKEIREWHRRLARTGSLGTSRRPSPVPCPRCGTKSLEIEDGATYVECVNGDWEQVGRRCGQLISRGEYDGLRESWMRDAQPVKMPQAS
jgi:hypothetical protein